MLLSYVCQLGQLKSDLRDVLYSHKWSPDAYLLAKAYVMEDEARETANRERLPRLQLKQPTRKLWVISRQVWYKCVNRYFV